VSDFNGEYTTVYYNMLLGQRRRELCELSLGSSLDGDLKSCSELRKTVGFVEKSIPRLA
jgi:hypothetical protein